MCSCNVQIPNGTGFGLGAAQLLVCMIYGKGKPRREGIREEDVKTEGFKLVGDIEMGGEDGADSKSHPNNLEEKRVSIPKANIHGLRKHVKSLSLDSGKLQSDADQLQFLLSLVPHHEGEIQKTSENTECEKSNAESQPALIFCNWESHRPKHMH
uniref:Uncharacterized protein n=1 Tax=Picea sitchensis TaxID=3332 RepID=D5AB78_PICSI|nr:unknown [Picea sitchensis]